MIFLPQRQGFHTFFVPGGVENSPIRKNSLGSSLGGGVGLGTD